VQEPGRDAGSSNGRSPVESQSTRKSNRSCKYRLNDDDNVADSQYWVGHPPPSALPRATYVATYTNVDMATNEMRHLREIAYPNANVPAWHGRFKERCFIAIIRQICRIVIDLYDVGGLTTPVPSL